MSEWRGGGGRGGGGGGRLALVDEGGGDDDDGGDVQTIWSTICFLTLVCVCVVWW